MITDSEAKAWVAQNVNRLLGERGRSAYWLMKTLGAKQGTIYPVVRGEVLPSVAMTARIAEALSVTVDELLKKPKKVRHSA